MKKIYVSVYNFFIILKVFCPIISFLYALLWFISFLKLSFYQTLSIPFEPFAQIIKTLHPLNIEFQGNLVDMSYIAASGLFIVFHYIFGFFAQRVIDLYNFDEMLAIRKKNKEVKKINIAIKKEYEQEVERFSRFALLFNLDLKPTYNLNISRKGEFDILKKEFYTHIVKNVSSKYKNAKGIMSDKLFLVCDDFDSFDDFILRLIGEIKTLKKENSKKDIITEFSVSIDAIKSCSNVFSTMEFLEKVDSFNYKNKLVVTSAFKIKYEQKTNTKFKLTPLGISRFFEDPDDYTDFELFGLKFKRAD